MENTQAAVLNDFTETTPPITLTAAASVALLQQMLLEQGDELRHYLRVFVAGGGCAGLRYGLALDSNVDEEDTVFDADGAIPIVVDSASLPRVRGSVVDHVDTDMGGTFKIENPNATRGCGCGSSFGTGEWDDEQANSATGCGGCPGGACGI